MSDENNGPCQATPHHELIAALLDCRVPKSEREHAAGREIKLMQERIIALETENERLVKMDALRARVAELQAEHEKLVKSINRAGGLTSQGASHELIRQILSEALEGKSGHTSMKNPFVTVEKNGARSVNLARFLRTEQGRQSLEKMRELRLRIENEVAAAKALKGKSDE